MKLEQSIMNYNNATGAQTGYIDIPRGLSAVNGKSIAQTKRSKGKYKPLGFLIRVRALTGDVIIQTLNCGYPTRNAVVLAGHARDEMLKSSGISRSNLESYQKELRLLMDGSQLTNHSNMFFPGATDVGTGSGGWGHALTYDYTKLVISDPDTTGTQISASLRVLGEQSANHDDWDVDGGFYVIDNWKRWRHSFTPAAADDDIKDNVFSWAIQQSDTSAKIIDMMDDSQDEKPYDLDEFKTQYMTTVVGTEVGNPTSSVICAPLGLIQAVCTGTAAWEIEVLGVVEL